MSDPEASDLVNQLNSGIDQSSGDSLLLTCFNQLLKGNVIGPGNTGEDTIINNNYFTNEPLSLDVVATTKPTQANVAMNNFNFSGMSQATSQGQAVEYQQWLNSIPPPAEQLNLQQIQTAKPVTVLDMGNDTQIKCRYLSAPDDTVDLQFFENVVTFTKKAQYLGFQYPDHDKQQDQMMFPPRLYVDTEIATAINNLDPTYTPASNIVGGLGGRPVFLLQTDPNSNNVTQLDGVQDGSALGNVTSFRQFQEATITQAEATALVQTNLDEEAKTREDADTAINNNLTNNYKTTHDNDLRYVLLTTALQNLTKCSANLDVNGFQVVNAQNGNTPQSLTTLSQVNALIAAQSQGLPSNSTLATISNTNASVSSITASNQKIVSLLAGDSSGQAVNYDQLLTEQQARSAIATNLSTNYSTTAVTNSAINSAVLVETNRATLAEQNLQTAINNKSTSTILSSDTNSSLSCVSANEIAIKVNGIILGKLYQPTGQATTPLGIFTTDKLQFSSGMNATTIFGNNVTPVNAVIYNALRVQNTDVANSNCYSGLEISTSGGNISNTANMSLSSGHVNLLNDGIQRPFQGIVDQNNSAVAFQISVANPFISPSETAITQYRSTFAVALGLPQHSFQGTAGYNQTTTISLPNQFSSKKYVDDLLTLYYTKLVSDSRFVLQTTPLQSITKATGSLDINSQRIVNCLDPVGNQDVATRAFVLANGGGLPTSSTLNSISSTNLTSGSVNMNSNKLTNLALCTLSTDAANKAYVDSVITPQQQQYVYTNSNITNSSYVDIIHNLASDIDGLVFQLYVKYKSATNGYTTSQWINLGTIDRSQTLASQFNLQIMSHTTNVSNQCRVYFCNDGVATIDYTGGGFSSPNWSGLNVKIVITKNNGFLVLSSQYATSNLTVNSDIDLLNSSYRIKNSPDAIANGDIVPLSQLTSTLSSYATTSSLTTGLNTRYAVTTKLNEITAPNGSVNMVGQKVTGLALATANTDAVSLIQLNNKTYSQITALDGTSQISATSFLIQSSSAERHVANDNRIASSSYLFNSTTNSSPNTTSISACMTVNDQVSQVNDNQSRWALQVLATVDNISPQIGTNYQAFLCSGLALFSQRIGAGQTTATELLKVEGKCLASQFLVWTPSRQAFKRDIVDYNNPCVLDLVPKKYRYAPESHYVQTNNVDTTADQFGFVYEDVISSCGDHPEFFYDESRLNMTEIKDSILYSLMNENRKLKQQLSAIEQRLINLESKIQ